MLGKVVMLGRGPSVITLTVPVLLASIESRGFSWDNLGRRLSTVFLWSYSITV